MRKKQQCIYSVVWLLLFLLAMTTQSPAQKHRVIKPKIQTARVLITERGYSRNSITLRRGIPARITFLRQTDATCATEVVIAAYGINRSLPLNTPVSINFTPKSSGEFNFTCGMNMMRGKLVVQ